MDGLESESSAIPFGDPNCLRLTDKHFCATAFEGLRYFRVTGGGWSENFHLGNVRKIGYLCFFAFFCRETNLLFNQWQVAAKTAQNVYPYLRQDHRVKYV